MNNILSQKNFSINVEIGAESEIEAETGVRVKKESRIDQSIEVKTKKGVMKENLLTMKKKDRDKNRDKDKDRDKHKDGDDVDKEKDKDKLRGRDRDKDKELDKEKDRDNKHRDNEKVKDRDKSYFKEKTDKDRELDDRDKKKTKKRRRSSSSSKELKQQKYRKSNEGKHIPTTEKAVDEDTPNQQSENSIKVELGDPKDVPVLGFLDNSTSDDNETKISEQPTHKDNDRSDSHSTSPKKRISEKKRVRYIQNHAQSQVKLLSRDAKSITTVNEARKIARNHIKRTKSTAVVKKIKKVLIKTQEKTKGIERSTPKAAIISEERCQSDHETNCTLINVTCKLSVTIMYVILFKN